MEHRKDVTALRAELPSALESAIDPARLVLQAIEGFYDKGSGKTEKKDLGLADQRRACSLLLESLLPLLADPIMGAEPIIPIFYAVKPSTLRDAVDGKGTFDASLRTLEGETITDCHTRLPNPRYDTKTVNKWRKGKLV